MIVQFPAFYPDELVYSLLARYSARSGYLRYTFAAEELLERPGARPDPEFVNRYTAQAVEAMTPGALLGGGDRTAYDVPVLRKIPPKGTQATSV